MIQRAPHRSFYYSYTCFCFSATEHVLSKLTADCKDLIFPVDWLHLLQHFPLFVIFPFLQYLDHNHPTSPLLAKPPELSEEAKLPASMKFVAANTVGE